jgi:hypothetical protein
MATLWGILQHRAQELDCDGVAVTSNHFGPDPESLERNRAAPCERVQNYRRSIWVTRGDKLARGLKVRGVSGEVPIRERGDEVEQSVAQPHPVVIWTLTREHL